MRVYGTLPQYDGDKSTFHFNPLIANVVHDAGVACNFLKGTSDLQDSRYK